MLYIFVDIKLSLHWKVCCRKQTAVNVHNTVSEKKLNRFKYNMYQTNKIQWKYV